MDKIVLRKRLLQLEEVQYLALKLFENDQSKTTIWMHEPNDSLFGASPAEAVYAGGGEEVLEWLRIRSGKSQGSTV
jgi:uncharacterized protein (DUF2384 family)